MQILKSGLKPRRSFFATLVLVGVVASVMGLTPTKGASNTLAESCANPPAVPTFNYWPVTYNDANTPLCHDFPAIDAAIDQNNPQFSQSEADYNDGLVLADGQQAAALLYLHNGAANNLDPALTTAKNVKIITETEQNIGDTHKIKVTYTADNAAPYTKSFTVKTAPNSKLEVVPNTGFMYNYEGRLILDQQNLNLGNSTFNLGDLNACFEFSIFLTYKFKAVPTTPTPTNTTLSIEKQVKNITVDPNTGRGAMYANSANAKQGEQVGYRVLVTNTGSAVAQNVTMTDNSVAGVSVNAGSTTVGTADDALLGSGWSGSIPGTVNLGNLQPGESRIIKYTATVNVNSGTLVNTARAVATNAPQVQDDASVIVTPIIVPPVGNPGLTIKKLVKNNNQNTAFADSVSAKTGEWVRFQVTITNNGTANLTGARITDAIPAGLEFENTAVSNGAISFNNNTLIVIFDSAIPAGQSRSVEFNAQVKATGPTTICNVAVGTGNNVAQVQDSACVNVTAPIIVGTPKLVISKLVKNNNNNTAYADSVDAKTGEWVRFKVTITNTGTADLTGATIVDTLPSGLEFENTAIADNGSVNFANSRITVTFPGAIAAGQSRTLEFNAQVRATGNTTICNIADAYGNAVASVQDNACVRVMGTPNLTISKLVKNNNHNTAFADSVDAKTGEWVRFQVTIANTGNADLTGARITDTIPAGLEFENTAVANDGTISFVNGVLTVMYNGVVPAGHTRVLEFNAQVKATGNTTICNVAVGNGNNVAQVQDNACVRVMGTPNLAIQKWVKTGGAYADSVDAKTNELVTFKITITNTGTAELTGAVITDVIPTGLTFDDSVSTDGTSSFNNNTLTVSFASPLAVGQSKTVEFAAKVAATGPTTICNVAKATGNSVTQVQDDACVRVTAPPVVTNPKISIKKFVKNISTSGNYEDYSVDARTGERAGFKITVTNTGDTTLSNVKVTDVIPTGLEFNDSVSGDGTANFSGTTFTVDFGSMTAGQSKTVEFATKVLGTGPTTVCNIAKANASGVSEVQDDACVKIYTTPKPGDANIVLSKKAFNDTKNVDAVTVSAARGDYITYTLITTNNGTADKTNYVITDDLSQVLSLVDMVSLNGGTLSGNMLTFPAITIKAGETVTKTFKVRVKQTLSAELTYQLKNTYGNTIVINVPGKTVYEAPTTGAAGTSAGIFAGLLTAGFVVARKRDSILKFVLNS